MRTARAKPAGRVWRLSRPLLHPANGAAPKPFRVSEEVLAEIRSHLDGAETVRDVLLATFRERFEEAGLIEPEDTDDGEDNEREAA